MATRTRASTRGLGFYCEVEVEEDAEESECVELRDGVLEECVYTVERLVGGGGRRLVFNLQLQLYNSMCAFILEKR